MSARGPTAHPIYCTATATRSPNRGDDGLRMGERGPRDWRGPRAMRTRVAYSLQGQRAGTHSRAVLYLDATAETGATGTQGTISRTPDTGE